MKEIKELVGLIGRIRRLGRGVATDDEKSVESVLRCQFNDIAVVRQCGALGAVWKGQLGLFVRVFRGFTRSEILRDSEIHRVHYSNNFIVNVSLRGFSAIAFINTYI
jgi:hypothetical protein